MATDQYSVLGKAPGSDELKKLSQDDVFLTIKKLNIDLLPFIALLNKHQ